MFIPFGEGHPFDLVLHLETRKVLRIQCKTARYNKGCILFNSRSTDHGQGPQSYAGLADLFGVFAPALRQIYLIPVTDLPGLEGRLRVDPTLNNQRRLIRWADRYEIDRWTRGDLVALTDGLEGSPGPLRLIQTEDRH